MNRVLVAAAVLSAVSVAVGCWLVAPWLGLIVQGGLGLLAVYVAAYLRARAVRR